MFHALFHRLVPASLGGGKSLYSAVSNTYRELRDCERADLATRVLERSKLGLYTRLRRRFSVPEAQALTLKVLNICLARYHFQARHTYVLSRPIGVVADPSNMCRLACPGCVHSAHSQEHKLFDWLKATLSQDHLSTVLKLFGPFAIGAYFCNYGEPLLNVKTPDLVRLAKSYLMGTALSTSLSVERFDPGDYVESGLDLMVLSIDGATQRVYETFRRNGNLELVFANIRRLVDARRGLGRRTPVLSWNFLAFEHNAHEIPLAVRKARELGVNMFRVVTPFDVTWDNPEIRPATVKPGVRRLHWVSSSNLADNWNPFPAGLDTDTIGRAFETPWDYQVSGDERPTSGHTCHWLYKNTVIDAAGRVMPCCGPPEPDGRLVFTTIGARSGSLFNSEKYRLARSVFNGAISVSDGAVYCRQCEWNQTTVSIGGPEIRRYFRAADPSIFDHRTLLLLSEW
jgi:MoaA/NifB/PqqE/SkfB family radical SAM enzyme